MKAIVKHKIVLKLTSGELKDLLCDLRDGCYDECDPKSALDRLYTTLVRLEEVL